MRKPRFEDSASPREMSRRLDTSRTSRVCPTQRRAASDSLKPKYATAPASTIKAAGPKTSKWRDAAERVNALIEEATYCKDAPYGARRTGHRWGAQRPF